MEGARIISLELRRPDLRFPFSDGFASLVQGRTVTALSRRAKYLLIHLDDGQTIISHLGMSGSFKIDGTGGADAPGAFHHERSKISAHDHAVFSLEKPDGAVCKVTYNDPRRFGFMLLAGRGSLEGHPALSGLGIEPLGNELSGPFLQALFEGRRTPLKSALLDQRQVAGLGNIYVCEALWRAKLSPLATAGTLSGRPKQAESLASAIRGVLTEAIEAGGSTLRDHRQADGTLGYFQHRFAVYGREGEPCPRIDCAGTIERLVQSGRSTFLCPACQKQGRMVTL